MYRNLHTYVKHTPFQEYLLGSKYHREHLIAFVCAAVATPSGACLPDH